MLSGDKKNSMLVWALSRPDRSGGKEACQGLHQLREGHLGEGSALLVPTGVCGQEWTGTGSLG